MKAGPNTTSYPPGDYIFKPLLEIGHKILRDQPTRRLTVDELWACVSSLTTGYQVPEAESPESGPQVIAHSSATSTCYAPVLCDLSVPREQGIAFDLLDGLIVFEGRYYRTLGTEESNSSHSSEYEPRYGQLTLSDTGTPDGEPLMTLRDGFNTLILGCSATLQDQTIDIDIWIKIDWYLGMFWCGSCSHPLASPLNNDKGTFIEMCLAMPVIEHGQGIGIFMMRGDPMAQLFACNDGVQSVLVRDCCLQCATKEVNPEDFVMFVIG